MPQYDYKCAACKKSFTKTMGIKEHDAVKIACPKCSSEKVEQQISMFAAITRKKS